MQDSACSPHLRICYYLFFSCTQQLTHTHTQNRHPGQNDITSLNGLLGSVDAVKHIFEGAQSAPLHPQRRLTITGQDGSETLLVLPVPPHHFFSYRRPGGDARGYQLVICGHLVSPEARVWLRQGIGDLHGREWEQQEEGGEEEAATEHEAATTLGREDEAEALINLAADLVSELQSHEYLFTTDVKNIAALVFVATFLSKMVPVTASFKSKEALQQALWRVVLAPWKAPPSFHVGHVMAAPPPLGSCPDSRPYLVSRQYIGERRRNVLAVMVGLFQLPNRKKRKADRQSSRVSVRALLSRVHAALTWSPSSLDGEECSLTAPSGVSPLCSGTLSTTYSPNTADRLFSCLTGVKKLLIGGGVTAEEEGGHSKKMFKRDMEVMEREVNKVRRGNNTTHPIRSWMMAKSVDYEEGLQGRQGDAVVMRRGGGSGSTKKRQARKSSGGGKSVLVAKKGETTQAAKTQKVRSRRTKQKHAVRYKDRIVSKMNGIITMKEVQKAGGHLGGAARVTTQKTGK